MHAHAHAHARTHARTHARVCVCAHSHILTRIHPRARARARRRRRRRTHACWCARMRTNAHVFRRAESTHPHSIYDEHTRTHNAQALHRQCTGQPQAAHEESARTTQMQPLATSKHKIVHADALSRFHEEGQKPRWPEWCSLYIPARRAKTDVCVCHSNKRRLAAPDGSVSMLQRLFLCVSVGAWA
eukprot:6208585-Pleurochrysis_carterae.AAC.3